MTATREELVQNKCTPASNMSQCSLLDPATDLVNGQQRQNMVNFLRGQTPVRSHACTATAAMRWATW